MPQKSIVMIEFKNINDGIVIPSDIKLGIKLKSNGEYVDFSSTENSYLLVFFDSSGNGFECEATPTEKKNCKVDDEDSTLLHVMIETKGMMRGRMSLQIGAKFPDDDFSDGHWHVFKAKEETNIMLK